MKRVYLIVLAALILGSCKKEDPVDPTTTNNEEPGSVTFYITSADKGNIDFPITISIDGVSESRKLNGAPTSGVDCETPSTLGLRIWKYPGTYNWKAIDEGSWSDQGVVIIEDDVCQTKRLLP